MSLDATKFRLLTRDDYAQTPIGGPLYQLIEGNLHMSPTPSRYHQTISRNLVFILLSYLKSNPIGVLYQAPFDVYLSDINVFQPDILFIASDRKNILTEKGIEGAPDFVIEILSPGTERFDRGPKREVYAHYGVKELWIISADIKQILIYHLQEDSQNPLRIAGAQDNIQSPLFPELTVSTAEVFKDDI